MARCLKSEGLKGDGTGCIKPGGHGGRCKVRDEPKRRYLAGGIDDTPAPRRGAKPGRHTGGGGLKDLARIVDRVEAEDDGQ